MGICKLNQKSFFEICVKYIVLDITVITWSNVLLNDVDKRTLWFKFIIMPIYVELIREIKVGAPPFAPEQLIFPF